MRHFLFLLPIFSSLCFGGEMRTWTDDQGRTVAATLLRVEAGSAMLKLQDGREVPYPLAKLSAADREFIAKAATATPDDPDNAANWNFDAPWPDRVKFSEDPEITVVKEDAAKKEFVYESANYRYVSDVRLSKSVVKGFAILFEATYAYCRTVPLAFNGGARVDGKLQILLFEQMEDYAKAGGPPGTAGVFMSAKSAVLVPLDSIGVKPLGSGYTLDRDKSSDTIPHELTHQLSPDEYFVPGARGWFSEGIAEYVANTPYRSGGFNVRGNLKPIVESVTAYGKKGMGGRALGNKIKLPSLKQFMLQDYASFQSQPQLGYGAGLLMTTYFLHLDGDGDARRIKAFLKALHQGKSGEDALTVLLDGRTFGELEKEFTKAWSRNGIDFTFGGS